MDKVNHENECQGVSDLLSTSLKTTTTIRKWGNSDGIRIPKLFMEELQLKSDQEVEVCIAGDSIIIRKVLKKKYKNLKERMEDFYQKPLEEIIADRIIENTKEVDWGIPKGEEIW